MVATKTKRLARSFNVADTTWTLESMETWTEVENGRGKSRRLNWRSTACTQRKRRQSSVVGEQGEQTDMTTSWGLTLKAGVRQFGSWHNKDAIGTKSVVVTQQHSHRGKYPRSSVVRIGIDRCRIRLRWVEMSNWRWSFAVRGRAVWNCLPPAAHDNDLSLNTSKPKLKTHLRATTNTARHSCRTFYVLFTRLNVSNVWKYLPTFLVAVNVVRIYLEFNEKRFGTKR